MINLKGNKGEWSEFYAFLKLLSDGELFGADKNLNPIKDKRYPLLRIFREEREGEQKVYDLSVAEGEIIVFDENTGEELNRITSSKIKSSLREIFKRVKNSSGLSFGISLANPLAENLRCTSLKTGSWKKSDFVLDIYDGRLKTEEKLGFSVKSMIGSPPTLLNPSRATNFIYKIENLDVPLSEVNSIVERPVYKNRLRRIFSAGGELTYAGIERGTFEENLRKIDTLLPEILSEVVKAHYSGKGTNLTDIVSYLGSAGIHINGHEFDESGYAYKLKSFLEKVALGMLPGSSWLGRTKVRGGYVVVKENGELVGLHLHDSDEFRDYLFENTRLDSPSSSRYGYGNLYEDTSGIYLKLNLQVRFKK